jgi:hypothetical protein
MTRDVQHQAIVAFSRFRPVHWAALVGQQRVESARRSAIAFPPKREGSVIPPWRLEGALALGEATRAFVLTSRSRSRRPTIRFCCAGGQLPARCGLMRVARPDC